MLSCQQSGEVITSRSFHRRGLLYAAIAVLAGAYAAHDEVAAELERQRAVNYLTIFLPRLALALIIGFMIYGLFRKVGSVLNRLHGTALAAQPIWHSITSKP
jgi:hypothetical protein